MPNAAEQPDRRSPPTTISNHELGAPADPLQELQPGDVLFERFRIEERLGRGGTGDVFAVVDLEAGAPLALKALRVARPGRVHLIKSEFRAVQGIVHPHLVAVHELFVDRDRAFLTMDLVEGSPLTEVWNHGGAAAWQRLRRLFHQCVVGLSALHERGLVHSDVKPANILVDEAEHVTVIDFGLAGRWGRSGSAAGTPAYMAPEQILGEALTPASDWYAVGAMLYQCLTGRLPFEGAAAEIHAAKRRQPPAAPSSLDPRVPRDLDELCVRLLRTRPEERPAGNTLRQELAGGLLLDVPRPSARQHFIGRVREQRALRAACDALTRGEPSLVVVRGPAGAGKSTILRRLLDDLAADSETIIHVGACNEYENVAFNAFDVIVDALAQRLKKTGELGWIDAEDLEVAARVFPILHSLSASLDVPPPAPSETLPHEQRRAAFRVLARILAKLGERGRLVIAIDDVQWADLDSIDLLRELVSHPSPPALVLIACWRTGEETCPFVQVLRHAPATWSRREVPVGPLSSADSLELARALAAGTPSVETIQRVATESGGNPLLIEELAALVGSGVENATLESAIRHRVELLAASERHVLELISAYGRPLPRDLVHRIAAPHGGRRVVKRLCDLRLARWTGHREDLDVYHPRIREEVYATLAGKQIRERHESLVETFTEWRGATPALLAEHLHRAGQTRRALEQMRLAADEAAANLAFHQAAKWLRLALTLTEASASRTTEREIRTDLADTLAVAGIGGEAANEYAKAAALGRGESALELRRKAAEQLMLCGRHDEGFALLDDVLRRLGVRKPRTTAGALASLLAGRARLRLERPSARKSASPEALQRIDALAAGASGYVLHDSLRGAWFASRQLLHAQRAGDPTRLLRALINEALYLANEGTRNGHQLDSLIERARGLTHRARSVEAEGLLQTAIGVGSLLVGRWDDAITATREAERRLSQPGAGCWWELIMCRKFRSIASWFRGTLVELDHPLQMWLDDAAARGDDAAYRSFAGEQAILSLALDRVEAARGQTALMGSYVPEKGFDEHRVVWLHNRIHLSFYTGAGAPTLLRLVRELRPFWRSLLARSQLMRTTSQYFVGQCFVEAHARGGPDVLLARAESAASRLERERATYATLYAQMLRAAIAHRRGDDGAARRILARASRGFAADDQLLASAGARWRLGELTGGRHGRSLVEKAREEMTGLGIGAPGKLLRILAAGFDSRDARLG